MMCGNQIMIKNHDPCWMCETLWINQKRSFRGQDRIWGPGRAWDGFKQWSQKKLSKQILGRHQWTLDQEWPLKVYDLWKKKPVNGSQDLPRASLFKLVNFCAFPGERRIWGVRDPKIRKIQNFPLENGATKFSNWLTFAPSLSSLKTG